MISITQYAQIAGHVYQPKISNYMGTNFYITSQASIKKVKLKNGWHIMTDVDSDVTPAGDFFAALYLKFSKGKATDAVIAIRGTDTSKLDNLITDVVSWYSSAMGTNWHDHFPHYFSKAAEFCEDVFEYIGTHFPEIHEGNVRLTGHSLGGALAQLMSFRCFFIPCVVFNSPSCRGLGGSRLGQVWPLIVNVNSRYGVINKIGGNPLGKLNVVDVSNMEAEAKTMFEQFDQQAFKAGEKIEQIGAIAGANTPLVESTLDTIGTDLHLGAILGAGTNIDKLPAEHMKIMHCESEQEHEGLTATIYKLGKDASCDMAVTLTAMAQTILAQHKIEHVINALSYTPKIAGKII